MLKNAIKKQINHPLIKKSKVIEKYVHIEGVKLWIGNPRLAALISSDEIPCVEDLEDALRKTSGYRKLKSDIKKNGQLEGSFVGNDGIAYEGNTRLLVLRDLYEETRDPKFLYYKAIMLPSDFSDAELASLLLEIHVVKNRANKWSKFAQYQYILKILSEDKMTQDMVADVLRRSTTYVSRANATYKLALSFAKYLEEVDLSFNTVFALVEAEKQFTIIDEIARAKTLGTLVKEGGDNQIQIQVFNMIKNRIFGDHRKARNLKDVYQKPHLWEKLIEPNVTERNYYDVLNLLNLKEAAILEHLKKAKHTVISNISDAGVLEDTDSILELIDELKGLIIKDNDEEAYKIKSMVSSLKGIKISALDGVDSSSVNDYDKSLKQATLVLEAYKIGS
ncbi:hypothetical protein [Photobacterium damselae]|uniref:hypothetical protein n=1 Tax=Photobacterium damselae TaxID=38293 RepID=UPI0030F3E941